MSKKNECVCSSNPNESAGIRAAAGAMNLDGISWQQLFLMRESSAARHAIDSYLADWLKGESCIDSRNLVA